MHPILQNRWKCEATENGPALIYYGLRNPPANDRQVIPVSEQAASAIALMDGTYSWDEIANQCVEELDAERHQVLRTCHGMPYHRRRPENRHPPSRAARSPYGTIL